MRRKRLILGLALGALAVGVILLLLREPSEPVFEGQKLGYWIRKSLNKSDLQMEAQAERAVKAAGTNAIPYLLDQFTRPPPRWTRILNQIGQRFHIQRHAETEDERISVGVFGLTTLGEDASPALPALAGELAKAPAHRAPAAALLMRQCGDKSIPFFRTAIKSTNTTILICLTIGLSPNYEGTGFSVIKKLLVDPDSEIRRKTVGVLGGSRVFWHQLSSEGVIRALHDTESDVQIAAAEALAQNEFAPQKFAHQSVVTTLVTLMTNSNVRLAQAASNAVRRIDPAAILSRLPSP